MIRKVFLLPATRNNPTPLDARPRNRVDPGNLAGIIRRGWYWHTLVETGTARREAFQASYGRQVSFGDNERGQLNVHGNPSTHSGFFGELSGGGGWPQRPDRLACTTTWADT